MEINRSIFSKTNTSFEDVKEAIKTFKSSERYDLVTELKNEDLINSVKEVYKKFESRKHFVQIGIGGSSLGSEMLVSSLQKNDREFTFINNIDPDFLVKQLSNLKHKECLFYVVSKSGGTAETIASFAIVANILKENGIEEKDFKDYFIFATDPNTSSLLDLARELDITCLTVPTNIGGRFSVLTPVGTLAAIFAGVDIEELTNSAYEYVQEIEGSEEFFQIVNDILTLDSEGINQTVLMPYSSKLRNFSFWFVQLWAESLGKENKGLTPIPSYGVSEQHSQIQLFMEGPRDKLLFMINIKEMENDFSLSNNFNHPKLKILKDYSIKNLLDAEFFGTLKALREKSRHYIHLEIDTICEKELARLIIFFEYATILVGHLLKIDPFNQPGVEAGKIYAFEWLEK